MNHYLKGAGGKIIFNKVSGEELNLIPQYSLNFSTDFSLSYISHMAERSIRPSISGHYKLTPEYEKYTHNFILETIDKVITSMVPENIFHYKGEAAPKLISSAGGIGNNSTYKMDQYDLIVNGRSENILWKTSKESLYKVARLGYIKKEDLEEYISYLLIGNPAAWRRKKKLLIFQAPDLPPAIKKFVEAYRIKESVKLADKDFLPSSLDIYKGVKSINDIYEDVGVYTSLKSAKIELICD